MKNIPQACKWHRAEDLEDAVRLLSELKDSARVLAGGTDLMVAWQDGHIPPCDILDISGLKELANINSEGELLRIGSLMTFAQLQKTSLIADHYPLLSEAASLVGARAIQNRATIGGNIINASPAGDSLPTLLAYNAKVELTSLRGSRLVPYEQFHLGYRKTARQDDELLTAVLLPPVPENARQRFHKIAGRQAQAISKLIAAFVLQIRDGIMSEVRIAMGSVAPVPVRCKNTEEVLRGHALGNNLVDLAVNALERDIAPIDDLRSTAAYRKAVAGNLLRAFLQQ